MRKKEEKGKAYFRKKLLFVTLSLLFFILLIASFFGKNGWIEMYQSKKKRESLAFEIDKLKQRKNRLERDIEELERNPKAIEEKAREKLWLMEPDEIVIIEKEKNENKEKKDK